MKKSYFSILFALFFLVLISCNRKQKADAYGNFEATSVLISAQGNGQLKQFEIEEGQELEPDFFVGFIDTLNIFLEKEQLLSQISSLEDKLQEAAPEVEVLLQQKKNLVRERNRTKKLLKKKAATQKQLDDYNGEINLVNQRIDATISQTSIANRGILSSKKPLEAQVRVLENTLENYQIINPIKGTVLTKLVEEDEFVGIGTPLYKIANIEILKLRAYTSALLLQNVKLGDSVTVLTDKGKNDSKKYKGKITWISDKAEFTPKTIETKDERVNLVYALDVEVKNDGFLKIGMPGEVIFHEKK
ncbi:HlyD family secretion protein [Aureivirga marina]|uniref:HlyD family secretion protein n=1 Tax=Aureivirga marina TaxID=1182451 RepID=UPI0018C8F837|nr:HlyD family efflux transporter periplasmic adaptor subunit [Aureivirga marina]